MIASHGSRPVSTAVRRSRELVRRFEGKRILVVGDLMLDQYVRGKVERISPEAPVPVVSVHTESFVPGGAGNVARNLASLGARAVVAGAVGPDDAGRKLRAELSSDGIDVESVVVDSARLTAQKCRVVAERQQVVRYDRETKGPLSAAAQRSLLEHLGELLPTVEAVILSDYGKGVISAPLVRASIAGAQKRRIPILADPKVEHFKLYRRVTCITPNLSEAWAGMGRVPQDGLEALEDLGRSIIKALGCESLLITRGPEGMSLFDSRARPVHIPTQAREVFDVSGAGDTVVSVMALALSCAASMLEAAHLANLAAGIVVGKLGTAAAKPEELLASL